ncbi:MAG TPA: AMP-binding protein, partial [Ktedonobacteraceae bacterium]|nr:AMP-binding protein [Ktedonobacteraceae bacterium]
MDDLRGSIMKREFTELARESSTLVELLRLRATVQADLVAFTFLHDDGNDISLTYRELDQHAQRIATLLQQRATPGERALLLYPPGLDFITAFFGCLYAGIVAVPTYPPHSLQKNRALSKIQAILSDAQPSLVLTTTSLLPVVAKLHLHLVDFQRLILLDTTQNIGALSLIWQQPVLSRETLALLQYTSGSTATPKGVMVSHGNLLHNQSLMHSAFSSNEPSILVGWLPLYHDMGLIGNVLQPLYRGKPSALMSPVAFLQRPVRWLQLISRYPSVASGGPNFAYDLCVDRIPPEQRNTLNLSGWCFAFSGAEPIRFQTLERFTQAFACAGFDQKAFYPVYG